MKNELTAHDASRLLNVLTLIRARPLMYLPEPSVEVFQTWLFGWCVGAGVSIDILLADANSSIGLVVFETLSEAIASVVRSVHRVLP